MTDNLTGLQLNQDNRTDWTPDQDHRRDWRPAGDIGLSQNSELSDLSEGEMGLTGEVPLANYGDPATQEFNSQPGAVHEYKDKITGAMAQAKDFLGEKAGSIGGKIKDFTTDDLGGIANKAKDFAREKPGQAIMISAAVGLLLGLVVRGRR